MKKSYFLICLIVSFIAFSQVGINTPTPQATLDVNGNMMVRTTPPHPASGSYNVLAVNPTTKEVQVINTNLTSAVNGTIAKAEVSSGLTLLSLGIFSGYRKIDFAAGNIAINSGSHFSDTTDSYTVPTSGIYEVNYEFRYGTGVQLALLTVGGLPSIGILKNTGGTTTLLDRRIFSGANLSVVADLTISNSSINSIYNLAAGDQLSFAFNEGGISLGVIGSSFASVNIRKISD